MGDEEKYTNEEELIDVSEFEDELSEDALTEIAHPDDEEVTPIRQKSLTEPITGVEDRDVSQIFRAPAPRRGAFIASLRERFTAFFIDTLILFYLYWLYTPLYSRVFLGSWNAPIPFKGWHGFAMHASFLFICFLYYFVLEGIFLATIGKFICWMSVRKRNGEPASLISCFFRNVIRPIDYILIIPVVFIMELTSAKQRLGDLLSGTTVIKKFMGNKPVYKLDSATIAPATGRTIAFCIDTLIFLAFVAGYILVLNPEHHLISKWMLLLSPIVLLLYFILLEMITETSPGKWLLGYIICHESGRRLTVAGSVTRTIWRILDTNPFGFLCLFISAHHQRPGDTAASTLVVKHERKAKGGIGFLVAIIISAGLLYSGINNRNNILSPRFQLNFLPRITYLENIGVATPKYDTITIKHFRFAANAPNNIRIPPSFKAGETVYLVFELYGYKKKEREVWLQEDLSIRYPDGKIGLKQDNIVDYKDVIKGNSPIELTNNITLPNTSLPGQYEVIVKIRDRFAGKEVEEVKSFNVKDPTKREIINLDKYRDEDIKIPVFDEPIEKENESLKETGKRRAPAGMKRR